MEYFDDDLAAAKHEMDEETMQGMQFEASTFCTSVW
jgi:hypothetical protein